jgi:hypothetical protein
MRHSKHPAGGQQLGAARRQSLALTFLLLAAPGFSCSRAAQDSAPADAPPDECGECKAPSFCQAGACVTPGTPIVAAAVGQASGEFAASDPEEASPITPNSLTASADGRQVWILDTGNARIQLFEDSKPVKAIPLPAGNADDLVRLESGQFVVLDRQANTLTLLDAKGAKLATTVVTGVAIERAAYVQGLFLRPSGVWAELDRFSVLVLDANGQAVAQRRVLPGLLSRDGEKLITTERLGDGSLHLNVREAAGLPRYTHAHLQYAHPVAGVLAVDTDLEGRWFVVTNHSFSENGERQTSILLTVLDADLSQLRQEELPVSDSAREPFRPVVITDSGIVLQLASAGESVTVRRF